jgi:hypothetical protein
MNSMSKTNTIKQCCVFDTDSLIRLCLLELGTRRVIEWLLDDFTVRIPKIVFDEGLANIGKNLIEAQRAYGNDDETGDLLVQDIDHVKTFFRNRVDKLVQRKKPKASEKLISSRVPAQHKSNVHRGEKSAAALALELAYSHRQYVVFVTDDLSASEPLEAILSDCQVGMLKNSFDLLLFLATRHRHTRKLTLRQVQIALKQLNYISRDNSPSAPANQDPDVLWRRYAREVEKLWEQSGKTV